MVPAASGVATAHNYWEYRSCSRAPVSGGIEVNAASVIYLLPLLPPIPLRHQPDLLHQLPRRCRDLGVCREFAVEESAPRLNR